MAVATEGGLITPIVRSANTKTLAQISAEVGRPGIVSVPAAGGWVQRSVMRCLRELRRALCGLAGTSFLAPTAWLALPSSHPTTSPLHLGAGAGAGGPRACQQAAAARVPGVPSTRVQLLMALQSVKTAAGLYCLPIAAHKRKRLQPQLLWLCDSKPRSGARD